MRRKYSYSCENCNKYWIDVELIDMSECPYCGSSGLEYGKVKLKKFRSKKKK